MLSQKDSLKINQRSSYSDCDDEKIKFLSGAGIIYGMDDGTFAPDDNIYP